MQRHILMGCLGLLATAAVLWTGCGSSQDGSHNQTVFGLPQDNPDTRQAFSVQVSVLIDEKQHPVNRNILGQHINAGGAEVSDAVIDQIKALSTPILSLSGQKAGRAHKGFDRLCRAVGAKPVSGPRLEPGNQKSEFLFCAGTGSGELGRSLVLDNVFYPALTKSDPDPKETYWATVAASTVVENELAQLQEQFKDQFRAGQATVVLPTWGPLYSHGVERTDRLANTPAAGIYVADVLRVLSQQPGILMAGYSALVGDDSGDLLSADGKPRISFGVFKLYNDFLGGRYIGLRIKTPGFSSYTVGAVPAQSKLPLVVGRAVEDGSFVRVLLINKSMVAPADVVMDLGAYQPKTWVSFEELSAKGPWADGATYPWFEASGRLMDTQGNLSFRLEPHSLFMVTFEPVPAKASK